MFVIVVEGGPNDGKKIDINGEVGNSAPLEIEDLADAQDWIERNWERDFGQDAFVIDES
jgi:hypothetical protein